MLETVLPLYTRAGAIVVGARALLTPHTATAGEYTEVHSYTVQSYSGWASCTGYFWLQCASEQKTRQFAVVRIGSIVVRPAKNQPQFN